MSRAAHDSAGEKPIKLDAARANKMVQLAGGLTVLGLALAGAAVASDAKRFAFSYLTGFVWLATIGLGALFFVLIQHLTRAGWSVVPRRAMEWVTAVLPVALVLFAPIVLLSHDIYHHWMGPEAHHDEVLAKKAVWLNPGFFYLRAVIFLGLWTVLSLVFWRGSRKQDETGDKTLTLRMQAGSAPSILLFGITTTFAAFDWLMSLDPHRYSTIFGVYVFSGAATASLSVLALLAIALEKAGVSPITVEHRHDIGKLLFGFTVFWAYIAFSQFVLIWYANIPEETIWYLHRWHGSWKVVSLLLVVGHFVVPFIALLPRSAKRSATALGAVAVLMLVMHWVDLYWLVMPTLDEHGAHPSWIDLAGLVFPLGCGALALALRAKQSPVYPIKDPRLTESLALENV
jgi:predicted secreted protein